MTPPSTATPPGGSPSIDAVAELSCRPLKAMFLTFRKLRGDSALLAALQSAKVPLPLSYLEDESNWISFSLSCRILDALSEASGVPDFPRQAGLALATPEVLGFAYSILKAFGSPKLCYDKTLERATSFNKVGAFTIQSLEGTSLVLEYRSSVVEPNRRFCDYRTAQFQSFPTIWGLPLARAVEDQCQVNGAPCCRYRFDWQRRPLYPGTAVGIIAGGVGGFAGVAAGLIDFPSAMAVALAGSGLGGVFGNLLDSRRALRQRDTLLARQNADLVDSVQSLTQRFEEIQILNRTLEEKVDQRTHELSVARDRLQAALAKAVELDRAKTLFFTNISHELRTPLTLILAPLETALAEPERLPGDTRLQLEMMHRNGVRLLDNINQLLDLSRLDAGKARLKLEELDPIGVLRGLVEASQGLARHRGVELKLEAHGELPVVLYADREKLETIALNLIGNALKFTRPIAGRPPPWVTVRAGVEQNRFAFSVSDSGIGIPRAQLETIFERFSQVNQGDNREFGGSGIGLALVKELTEFHMGKIEVSSIEGVGSTFAVSLPLRRESIPEDRLDRRRESREVTVDRRSEAERIKLDRVIRDAADLDAQDLVEKDEPGVEAGPDRPLVLLADDNLDMLTFLSRLLRKDYRVLTAPDGETALHTAQRELPALIASDVMMPRMNGYQLVEALRKDQRTRHIPIILLTAKSELSQKIHGLEQGADDYLSKPFNFLEFKARVKSLLKTRGLERELAEKNETLSKLNFDLVLSKKEVFLQTIEAITFALEAKDTYTHGHSYRVSVLASTLAREIKLSESEIERVRLSALLHDVGKIGISEAVLKKPGKLTKEEYELIQRHPDIGARILEGVNELKDVTRCIRFHHESYDGRGYPGHLVGNDIPLESRVIAVADTYDAMTSDRAYRRGLPHQRAIDEIRNYSGRQFDPEMARAFLKLFEETPPQYPSFPSAFKAFALGS